MKVQYEFSPATADFVSACVAYATAHYIGGLGSKMDAKRVMRSACSRLDLDMREIYPLLEELERIRDSEVT